MIYIAGLTEFVLVGVFDRGQANKERIALRATQIIDTSPFCLMLGLRAFNQYGFPVLQPLHDQMFWLGDGVLQKDDWLFIYTGSGSPMKTTIQGSNDTAYVVHWGKSTTLFANPLVTPIVIRVGTMLTELPPADQLQYKP